MRRATWILWLMLALLPLRSWAVASMGVDMALAERAAAVAVETASPAPTDMPDCHQVADDATGTANCQSCDWCHAALAFPPQALPPGAAPPAVGPAAFVDRDTGQPPLGGLDRPPRLCLA